MTIQMDHTNLPDCLLCAVRTLTEGDPKMWSWENPGDAVTGVILKTGLTSMPYSMTGETIPYVDLWLGRGERIRVVAYAAHLGNQIRGADGKVGDTLTVQYTGEDILQKGKFAGRPYKTFQVTIQRGHHG